ncbi:MAG: alginate export family protein [Desulfobulbaceae bacterium]|nr:alginate export family protein [Desulfobulbaceae bacterium]
MKKTLTAAALSSVLVLGLAAVSQAADTTTGVVAAGATKVTIDGSVRERGVTESSSAAKDAAGKTGYDNRVQLGVNAQVSDQANGYVKLETGSGTSDIETWGNGMGANGGLTNGGYKMGSLTILEAWVNYNPGPVGVKAGHMPLALGNKIFFDHTGSGDDAIVAYSSLNDGATNVAALTIKFDEQTNTDNSNDLDGYVALITHKLNDNVNLGANWTYLNGSAKDETALPINGMGMSNIGLTADGKVGAISYLADVEMQFGTVVDDGTTSSDAKGWAAKVGADYDLGAGKIGFVFGYGSGQDLQDVNNNDTDVFVNFLTDTAYDTIIAGYRQAIPGAGAGLDPNGKNSGLSNLTLYQLKGSTKTVCPLTGKDLSIMGSLSYMNLSEDTWTYTDGSARTSGEDSVGTEVDLVATWALTAGLNYRVEAAYLFVGDVYQTNSSAAGTDPDDMMFLRHSLDLKF